MLDCYNRNEVPWDSEPVAQLCVLTDVYQSWALTLLQRKKLSSLIALRVKGGFLSEDILGKPQTYTQRKRKRTENSSVSMGS